MKNPLQEQTSMLLAVEEKPADVKPYKSLLGLNIDHFRWLDLLADEWLFYKDVLEWPHLGVGRAYKASVSDEGIAVTLWIDSSRLPRINVATYKLNEWIDVPIENIGETDQEIIWPGPIPLFSVAYFSVQYASDREKLIAMAKSFSNVDLPYAPIEIAKVEYFLPSIESKKVVTSFQTPVSWNSIRGAAAMAVWALPAADPWHDILCALLAIENVSSTPLIDLDAPWLTDMPWRLSEGKNRGFPLWRVMIQTFLSIDVRTGWFPYEILETICLQLNKCGIDLTEFRKQTIAILSDKESIDLNIADQNPLGLVLQLILLRPLPERFENWKKDLPGISPSIWWSGAILSGLLCGFRNLDQRFRGAEMTRKITDLRLWKIASVKNNKIIDWPENNDQKFTWMIVNSRVKFFVANEVWLEKNETIRGKWYRADFSNPTISSAAIEIAKISNKELIIRNLLLENDNILYSGGGEIDVDKYENRIFVKGLVNIQLPQNAKFYQELDVFGFREWIAKGSIKNPLPQLPELHNSKTDKKITHIESNPLGLLTIPNFISIKEEADLVNIIDQSRWSNELSRRVQHYGWKYNYKERKVSRKSYIGPLPEWAANLAQRLLTEGVIEELPDQVIVNEYVGNQGIGKHIDCPSCFRGAITTISLLESWGIIFRNFDQKFEKLLEKRSANIISGSLRNEWSHEIPKRKNEVDGPRNRRISLTFRKVNV